MSKCEKCELWGDEQVDFYKEEILKEEYRGLI